MGQGVRRGTADVDGLGRGIAVRWGEGKAIYLREEDLFYCSSISDQGINSTDVLNEGGQSRCYFIRSIISYEQAPRKFSGKNTSSKLGPRQKKVVKWQVLGLGWPKSRHPRPKTNERYVNTTCVQSQRMGGPDEHEKNRCVHAFHFDQILYKTFGIQVRSHVMDAKYLSKSWLFQYAEIIPIICFPCTSRTTGKRWPWSFPNFSP